MTTPIRVLIADDHPIYRDGLVRTIEEDTRFSVVAAVGSADAAHSAARMHDPDVALLDISMPGNGITAARLIAADRPATRIAMLTVSESDQDVMDALAAGAIGYVLKGVSAADLLDVLADVAAGRSHISATLAMRVMKAMREPVKTAEAAGIEDLTKREEDILKRVARGMSNRETAEALGLQEKTVKHYMTAILQKLQVRNRVEAALLARQHWDK